MTVWCAAISAVLLQLQHSGSADARQREGVQRNIVLHTVILLNSNRNARGIEFF